MLIKSGAFDQFGDRSDLLFNLDSIVAFAQKLQKEAASGQADLFGMLSEDLLRSEERRVGKECRSRWSPYH